MLRNTASLSGKNSVLLGPEDRALTRLQST